MFHSLAAWGALRRHLATALVVWTRPHSSIPACTDGRAIFVDPTLTEVETRCVLMHELIHVERGHTGCQPGGVERDVCLEAARRLVSFEQLRGVAGWARGLGELAEELGVTEEVVVLRLQTLDGDQLQELWPPSEHVP